MNARADVAGGGESQELDLSAGGQIVDVLNQRSFKKRKPGKMGYTGPQDNQRYALLLGTAGRPFRFKRF